MKDYKNSIFKLHCDCIKRSYVQPWNIEYYNSGGTGFAIEIDKKTYILTCYHVIANASKVFIDEIECKILFKSKLLDLALLDYPQEIEPLRLGEVETGEPIHVMGFPYTDTYFNVAYTTGVVSRLTKIGMGVGRILVYQIDAAAFPGNSGCPILNNHNEVCGVLFAGHNTSDIMNFIIPYFSIDYFIKSFKNGHMIYKIPDFTWQIVDKYMKQKGQLLINKKKYVDTIEGIPIQENGTIKFQDFLRYYGYKSTSSEDIPFQYLITFCNKSKITLDKISYDLKEESFEFESPEFHIFGDFIFVPATNGLQSEINRSIPLINEQPRAVVAYSTIKNYKYTILDIGYYDLVKKLSSFKKTFTVDIYNNTWILTFNPEDKNKTHVKKLFTNII